VAQSVRGRRNGHARGAVAGRPVSAFSPAGLVPSPSDPLSRFSDALSLLAVAHSSLSAKELGGTGDEEVAIRHALDALKGIYCDLDRASTLAPRP
jgi:hypothetical protein